MIRVLILLVVFVVADILLALSRPETPNGWIFVATPIVCAQTFLLAFWAGCRRVGLTVSVSVAIVVIVALALLLPTRLVLAPVDEWTNFDVGTHFEYSPASLALFGFPLVTLLVTLPVYVGTGVGHFEPNGMSLRQLLLAHFFIACAFVGIFVAPFGGSTLSVALRTFFTQAVTDTFAAFQIAVSLLYVPAGWLAVAATRRRTLKSQLWFTCIASLMLGLLHLSAICIFHRITMSRLAFGYYFKLVAMYLATSGTVFVALRLIGKNETASRTIATGESG